MSDQLSLSKRRWVAVCAAPLLTLGGLLLLGYLRSPSFLADPFFGLVRLALWLAFGVIEISLLWPLAWRWRANSKLIALALVTLLISVLFQFGHFSFLSFIYEVGQLKSTWGTLFVLVDSVTLAFLLAQLLDTKDQNLIREHFQQWLQMELGAWPGAAFMVALWAIVVVTGLVYLLTSFIYLYIHQSQPASNPWLNFILPLALIVAGLHHLVTQPQTRGHQAIVLTLGLGLAGLAYLLPSQLDLLPRLLGVEVPETVFKMAAGAWPLVSFTGAFALAASRRHRLAVGLKIMVVGICAGAALSILLAYPVYTWTLNTFVPTVNYSGSAHAATLWVSGFLAALVMLAVGPLVVRWTRPGSQWGKFVVGALAGVIAGGVLFGLLVAPAAGIAAQSTLYPAAISRVGYTNNEWVLKLAIGVVSVFPTLFGTTWLLLGSGALIGGLTGVFTPVPGGPSTAEVKPEWVLAELIGALGVPLVAVIISVVLVSILRLLGPSIRNVFDSYGLDSPWPTEWIMLGIFLQFWFILVIWQVLHIIWVQRYFPAFIANTPLDAGRQAYWTQFELSLYAVMGLGLAVPALFYLTTPDAFSQPVFLIANLVITVLSLELWLTWLMTRQVVKKELAHRPATVSKRVSLSSPWSGAGLVSGFITGILNYQFIMMAVSLVLVSIVLVAKLADETGPALGVDWLRQTTLDVLFTFAPAAFTALVLGHTWFGISGTLPVVLFEKPDSPRPPVVTESEPKPNHWREWLKANWRAGRMDRWLGGVLLVLAAVSVFSPIPPLVRVIGAMAGALLLIQAQPLQRFSWPVLVAAFSLSWVGLIVFATLPPSPIGMSLPTALGLAGGVVIMGVALALMSRAVITYISASVQQRVRLTALLCLVVLFGFFKGASQNNLITLGGVSRYDGRRWEAFTAQNSQLGNRLHYQIFADQQGQLWFGGGSSVVVGYLEQAWQSRLIGRTTASVTQRPEARAQRLGTAMRFIEDQQGRMWIAADKTFGQFDPEYIQINSTGGGSFSLRVPTQTDETQTQLVINNPISGLAADGAGNIWVATHGSGVLRLEGNRPVDDARWEFFTRQNLAFFSNEVTTVYADQAGTIWVGFPGAVGRFHEKTKTWDYLSLHGLPQPPTVTTLFQDSHGRLWMGTNHGLYQWVDERFLFQPQTVYWPLGASANTFFEDSQGGVWVGTSRGAVRLEAGLPFTLVPDSSVTAFAEEPAGIIWIGTENNLIRYDLATKQTEAFDSNNSGLATDAVQDLYVDDEGGLWVSTFAIYQAGPFGAQGPRMDTLSASVQPSSPLTGPVFGSALGLGVIFLGLFLYTYRGYQRTPETRAKNLAQQITSTPEGLYPTAYSLLAKEDDAPEILRRLSQALARAGDATGAPAVEALAALASDGETEATLQRSATALAAETRVWAKPLHDLHHLLASALAARRIPEISGLELAVNPGHEAGSITLSARNASVESLPPFLPSGTPEAWRALERVGVALRKYQDVDTAADRLSYLAQALAEVEKAQTVAQSVQKPESAAMVAIVERWHAAITDEINLVSGRAELRLELRTRQARRADQVTIALRLQNTGRAAAENVAVELQPSSAFALVGTPRVTLERLPSGRSAPVEFTLTPAAGETARLVCRLSWDDRVLPGNTAEFADVVRFYEVAEEFRRIPNPYIVGHPVKSAEMFQGREDVFQFIQDNLSGPVQDRTLVLHGQRRTGKTSILYQLLNGRLGPSFIPVLIDMQELALLVNSSSDFFNEVAYLLARAARKAGLAVEAPTLEAFTTSPTRAFNRFLDSFEETLGDRRVVVMFDEFELIEDKIAEGKLEANLLGYFRSLMQHRERLIFIFTGTHRLEEMSHDYWSILFNIALYRHISFLSAADAARLIRAPSPTPNPTPPPSEKPPMGEGVGTLDVDELAVEKIIGLTRGHPYFIQLLGWALVNHCNAQARNYATINDVNDALQEILTTGEAHFAYIWQQANVAERLALAGLAHTLRPGKEWARPAEMLETLAVEGKQFSAPEFVRVLDRLVRQDVLESANDGGLRYRFQLEVLRLWIEKTKSLTALVERMKTEV